MSLPSISNYGHYSSNNYGAHTLEVEVGPVTVWFSYKTPVAFRAPGTPTIVRQNEWGTTTGKHLKWIDGCTSKDKDSGRVTGERFEELWAKHVKPYFDKPTVEPGIFSGLGNLLD